MTHRLDADDADSPYTGTDTDTVSSLGEPYDYIDVQHLDDKDIEQELSWIYQRAKGRYRQYQKKPVRRVRRFLRKHLTNLRQGRHGNSRRLTGRGVTNFVSSLTNDEYAKLFFGEGGKGKGRGYAKGVRSSGKGMGRQKNPCGADGHTMRCTGKSGRFPSDRDDICQSEYHLSAECPKSTDSQTRHQFPVSSRIAKPSRTLQSVYVGDDESTEVKIERHSTAQDLLDNHAKELVKEVAKNQKRF